jgi:protein ImuB
MTRRYISIWFRHLVTDWITRQQPDLARKPFVFCRAERGRFVITAASPAAEQGGVLRDMELADAMAILPALLKLDHEEGRAEKILELMADWCHRYSPLAGLQGQDGLWLDITGGAHLFGGERKMLREIVLRFKGLGYDARGAMADTAGGAWAIARYGREQPIIPPGALKEALARLPPMALRIPPETAVTLQSLGLRRLSELYKIPRASLARRFGPEIVLRLGQALGELEEPLNSRQPAPEYAAKLNFSEGISSPESIGKVLCRLLDDLCRQMDAHQCGLRAGELKFFRLDGKVEALGIGTGSPSRSPKHLFRLFEEKLGTIDPGPGIELFLLSAVKTEPFTPSQSGMNMEAENYFHDANLPELADRLSSRLGEKQVYGLEPRQSHWPERAAKVTGPLAAKATESWPQDRPRPVLLLPRPEPIEVMAPVPDYPPMLFRHRGVLHRIKKAEGPERIEAEWWLRPGELRDYYRLEDEAGNRYWIFRLGHYRQDEKSKWFLHGYFS